MAVNVKGIAVTFEKEKETKGTFRYRELTDMPLIGTLYLRKEAATALGNPDRIVVTVNPD